MDEESRVLGRLEEFKEATNKRLDSVDTQFSSIHLKLDELFKFRWKAAGAVAFAMALVEVILKK